MKVYEQLLAELDHEAVSTRKMLSIIPQDSLDWAPHPKSFTMGKLASHITDLPGWAKVTIEMDVFEMDPASYKPFIAKTIDELLAKWDSQMELARTAFKNAPESSLAGTWTMKVNGNTVLSMPRPVVLRSFVFSHLVHHRAQLGVYLRLKDVPLPQVYGPTADEAGGFS